MGRLIAAIALIVLVLIAVSAFLLVNLYFQPFIPHASILNIQTSSIPLPVSNIAVTATFCSKPLAGIGIRILQNTTGYPMLRYLVTDSTGHLDLQLGTLPGAAQPQDYLLLTNYNATFKDSSNNILGVERWAHIFITHYDPRAPAFSFTIPIGPADWGLGVGC